MRATGMLFILSAAMTVFAGCGKDPVQEPETISIFLDNKPASVKQGEPVNVIATVKSSSGAIAEVHLVWNDGTAHTETMTATNEPDNYSGKFTPAEAGVTIEYHITARSRSGLVGSSDKVTLTVTEEGGGTGNPVDGLRLNEIGTLDGAKFIEIYNPDKELMTTLGGVSLWKNGELMFEFTGDQSIGAGNYGVLFAKGTTPGSGTYRNLGSTETGLSGSKSLLVELRHGNATIDAFSNTANPDIANAVWDDEPETDNYNVFIRKAGEPFGWYASATGATPGKANGSATSARLAHQPIEEDAMPSKPYIYNVLINPGTNNGITAGANSVSAEIYTDVFSQLSETTLLINGAGVAMTLKSGNTYEASAGFTGSSATISVSAANSAGTVKTDNMNVTVFASGTAFGDPYDIRLNEVKTSGTGGDWIEIYNPSDRPVAIGGIRIRKNKDTIFAVPTHMVLGSEQFGLLGCKDSSAPAGQVPYLYLGSVENGLSGDKSLLIELRRRKVGGEDNSLNIDAFANISKSVAHPDKDSDWDKSGFVEHTISGSAGCKPDGSGKWYLLGTSTQGASNSPATTSGEFTQSYNQ